MNNFRRFICITSSVVVLNACSSDKDKPFIFPASCIRTMIVGELSETIHRGASERDSSYAAAITNVWTKCEKQENKEHTVVFARFLIKRSQAGTEQNIQVPYFVALVDNEDTIFFKKETFVVASFTKHQKRTLPVQEVEITFPLPEGKNLEDLSLLVGLQVSEDQLERNIDKRKKSPAALQKQR